MEPLMRDTFSIVTRPGHPLARLRQPGWKEAAAHPWIMPPAGTVSRGRLEEAFAQAGVATPSPRIETASLVALQALLHETGYVSTLASSVAQLYKRLKLVDIVRLPEPLAFGAVGMMWSADAPSRVLAPAGQPARHRHAAGGRLNRRAHSRERARADRFRTRRTRHPPGCHPLLPAAMGQRGHHDDVRRCHHPLHRRREPLAAMVCAARRRASSAAPASSQTTSSAAASCIPWLCALHVEQDLRGPQPGRAPDPARADHAARWDSGRCTCAATCAAITSSASSPTASAITRGARRPRCTA